MERGLAHPQNWNLTAGGLCASIHTDIFSKGTEKSQSQSHWRIASQAPEGAPENLMLPPEVSGILGRIHGSDAMEREKRQRKGGKGRGDAREGCGRPKGQEFKVIPGYIVSWRVTWMVSNKQKEKKKMEERNE